MNCMQDLCFQTAKPPQSQGHFEQQAGIDVRRVLCLVAVISAIPLLPPFTPWRYAISSYLCICANQLHAPWADTHRMCTGIECNRLKYPQNIARNAVLGFSSFLIVCLGRCLHQSVFPLTVECRVSGQRGQNQSDVRPPVAIHMLAGISHCNQFSWMFWTSLAGFSPQLT